MVVGREVNGSLITRPTPDFHDNFKRDVSREGYELCQVKFARIPDVFWECPIFRNTYKN